MLANTTTRTRVGILAALLVVAISSWVFPTTGRTNPVNHAPSFIGNIPERTNLRICVQWINGKGANAEVVGRIASALAQVAKHPDFVPAGLARGAGPHVQGRCDQAPTIRTDRRGPYVTSKPSDIYTYIYIASEDELRGVLFKRYPRVTTQETQCEEHKCHEVTKALYITPEELADDKLLINALTSGVGLLLPDEDLSIYVDGVTPDDRTNKE
ncbi:hypothetical protein [Chloroflexus sp.]|uniref:hypothetical protein n=1 Tax=Chloroflexus sp. TaxID=1904827 RepID=UPI002ACD63A8|nr:hypothetical protein [Chloroflexus sp.]